MSDRLPEDLRFRSAHAPGLDEDDLFLALRGLPGMGSVWGEGRSWTGRAEDRPWDQDAERRRRHLHLLRKWDDAAGREAPPGP